MMTTSSDRHGVMNPMSAEDALYYIIYWIKDALIIDSHLFF